MPALTGRSPDFRAPVIPFDAYRARRFLSRPRYAWDGHGPVYSESKLIFFADADDVMDYCDSFRLRFEDLQLVLCERVERPANRPYFQGYQATRKAAALPANFVAYH